MQVNSINSVNFKANGYDSAMTEEMMSAVRNFDNMLPDRFVTKYNEDGQEIKQKSLLGTIASVAGATIVTFLISKKLLTKGDEAVKTFLKNENINKIRTSIKDFATKRSEKIAEQIQAHPKLNGVINNIKDSKFADMTTKSTNYIKNKVGVKNVMAATAAVAGAKTIASTDSNNDGVADIAQKGVNAYKATVDRLGVVGELVNALS